MRLVRVATRQHNGGRRDGVIGAVVLAKPEDIEPDLIGHRDFLDKLGDALGRRDGQPRRGRGADIAEGVKAQFYPPPPLF